MPGWVDPNSDPNRLPGAELSLHLCRSLLRDLAYVMRVEIGRQLDVGMAEHLLDLTQSQSACQQQRGRAVAKAVEGD